MVDAKSRPQSFRKSRLSFELVCCVRSAKNAKAAVYVLKLYIINSAVNVKIERTIVRFESCCSCIEIKPYISEQNAIIGNTAMEGKLATSPSAASFKDSNRLEGELFHKPAPSWCGHNSLVTSAGGG